MTTLYAIANEIANITREEELPEDVEARLDDLALALPLKVDACCRLVREWESDADRFKAEAARLSKIAGSLASKATRLRDYVRECLEVAGIDRLDTELFKLRLQASPPSARCEGDPHPAFQRVKVEWDRTAVIAAWREKLPLPEGVTIIVGRHLRGV